MQNSDFEENVSSLSNEKGSPTPYDMQSHKPNQTVIYNIYIYIYTHAKKQT